MKYSFIFVCQEGELEIKAMLLAASLKKNLRCEYQLIAAIPTPIEYWGEPKKKTINFLEKLDVEFSPITNEIDLNYPTGNKVSCLKIEVDGDIAVFVDSDMLCLKEFRHSSKFENPFCAKPADKNTFEENNGSEGLWEKVYRSFNLNVPESTMVATVTKELMPPYFNAGFIVVHSEIKLGEAWLMCCKSIDANPDITNKRPWLDQIALPVAIARLGIDYSCLDESYNYPCHLKPLQANNLPIMAHYHYPHVLLGDPVLRDQCYQLAKEHEELYTAFGHQAEWRRLLSPSF